MSTECYGLAPSNYEGQANPLSIVYSFYGTVLFTFILGVFVLSDYLSRRRRFSHSSEVSQNVKLINPFFLWGIMVYILGNGIVVNVISIAMFYSLRTFEAGHEMACYLAYYTSGGLNKFLYGNGNIIITPIFVLYILGIIYFLRPHVINKEIVPMVLFLSSLPVVADSSEKVQLLAVGAAEGARAISYAEGFEEEKVYGDRGFHVTCADVYGFGDCQTCIAADVVESNIARRGVQHCVSAMTIPPVEQPNSIDKVKFPEVKDETYDVIVLSAHIGMMEILAVYFEEEGSYIRNGRFINMMIELNRILKPSGFLTIVAQTIKEAETLRGYMRQGGFKTSVKVEHEASKTLTFPAWLCGGGTVEYHKGADKFYVVAQKDTVTDEEASRTQRKSSLSDVQSRVDKQHSIQLSEEEAEEEELTQSQWTKLWLLYILISLVSYGAFLAVTISFFDEMRFPAQLGFVNYFSWVMLGIAQNTVITLTVGVFFLRYLILRLPRVTFGKVSRLAAKLFVGEYFLGMIYTLPWWVITVLVKYYLVQEVFGIGTNTFMASMITGVIITILVRLLLLHVIKKAPAVELEPDEISGLDLSARLDDDGMTGARGKISTSVEKVCPESDPVNPLHDELLTEVL